MILIPLSPARAEQAAPAKTAAIAKPFLSLIEYRMPRRSPLAVNVYGIVGS